MRFPQLLTTLLVQDAPIILRELKLPVKQCPLHGVRAQPQGEAYGFNSESGKSVRRPDQIFFSGSVLDPLGLGEGSEYYDSTGSETRAWRYRRIQSWQLSDTGFHQANQGENP
jgi:hypothetical protein